LATTMSFCLFTDIVGRASLLLVGTTPWSSFVVMSIVATGGGEQIHIVLHVCCTSRFQCAVIGKEELPKSITIGLDLGMQVPD